MNYLKRQHNIMLISVMSIIFLNGCDSNKQKEVNRSVPSVEKEFHQFDVRDEIPAHIKSIENLSIFLGDVETQYSVKLIEEWRIGESTEPFLPNISTAVVDDQERVIVRSANSNYEQQLYIFDADGMFRTKLGRQGKGPGEYGIIVGMYAKSNRIFVLDYTSQRMNHYSALDYTYQYSILVEEWKAPDNFEFASVEPRRDGNYYVIFSNLRSKTGVQEIILTVKNPEGKEEDFAPLRFPVGYRITPNTGNSELPGPFMPLKFLGTTITALSPNDALFAIESQELLIKKYDSAGKYQSAIYYPIQGVPFDLEEYVESATFSPSARDIEKALSSDGIDIPEQLPVVSRLIIDDENRIWVALPTSSSREVYEWWILKETGELLAKLVRPRNQPIYDIKNGYLYSKQTNEETGSEYVVKYKIEFTER